MCTVVVTQNVERGKKLCSFLSFFDFCAFHSTSRLRLLCIFLFRYLKCVPNILFSFFIFCAPAGIMEFMCACLMNKCICVHQFVRGIECVSVGFCVLLEFTMRFFFVDHCWRRYCVYIFFHSVDPFFLLFSRAPCFLVVHYMMQLFLLSPVLLHLALSCSLASSLSLSLSLLSTCVKWFLFVLLIKFSSSASHSHFYCTILCCRFSPIFVSLFCVFWCLWV